MKIITQQAKTALQGSIAKWQKIVLAFELSDQTGEPPVYMERGPSDCPLCIAFRNPCSNHECDGCPIAEDTGVPYCADSPYAEWSGDADVLDDPETHEIAQAMLNYLVYLDTKLVTQAELETIAP